MSVVTADEANKIRALGIGKRELETMLATARREARDAALQECLIIAMTDGSTARIAEGISKLIGGR